MTTASLSGEVIVSFYAVASCLAPAITRPTVPFGVRVPPERASAPVIRQQRRAYYGRTAIIGACCIALVILLQDRGSWWLSRIILLAEIVADLGFVLASATSCFALIGAFLRFATSRRPMYDSISENAYGIYFVHYVFVLWLQYILVGYALFAVAKAAIVFVGGTILSWSTSAALCRASIGGRLMGGKRRELAKTP